MQGHCEIGTVKKSQGRSAFFSVYLKEVEIYLHLSSIEFH